jgi:hypothetical protein
MIETSLLAWLVLFLTILVSSAAGIAIAHNLPWNKANKDLNMPFTFGLAIAPYVLGAFTLVALHLLPGLSHNQHYTFILIGLIITIIGFSFFSKDSIDFKSFFKFQESYSISEKLLFIFLIAQTLSLILFGICFSWKSFI